MGMGKRYSSEFKYDTACLVLDQDYSVAQAAEATGAGISSVRKWTMQVQSERDGTGPTSGTAVTVEQRRIQELENRVRQLEMEKSILKKATALLMSDSKD